MTLRDEGLKQMGLTDTQDEQDTNWRASFFSFSFFLRRLLRCHLPNRLQNKTGEDFVNFYSVLKSIGNPF